MLRPSKRVDRQRQRWCDDAHDRRDLEPGAGDVIVETADHGHEFARQPDLLFGFAQRRGDRVWVSRLDASPGKRYLSGMGGEMRRPLGQQHRDAVRVVDQRHQHRRRPERGARW
jgi:hypothetical protein